MRKRNPENTKEVIDLIQGLVLVEMVEFIVPLSYLVCFITAYYGPNAHLMGNIRNAYWQYIVVEDVDQTISNIFLFFFIDLLSVITCLLMLWCSCRINLLKAYTALQNEFGLVFLVTLVFYTTTVSNYIMTQIVLT